MAKPTKEDITLREQELNIQKENLAVNKELLKIQRQQGTLNESDVRIQRSIANVLQDQVKYDKYSANEKRKITSLSKKLLDLSEKVYTFDVKGLGTTTKSEKIQKQILQTQQNLRILGLQRNKIGEKGSELQREINNNINLQIASTAKVTAQLERQRDAAKEIEGNTIANSFEVFGRVLNKIPLLSALAPAFKEGAEAAREAGAEITLFGKGMMDASDYTKESMKKMGPNAKVVSTMDTNKVAELEQAAAKAQAKLDKGGLKKGEAEKLQKVVQKGGDAKVGKETTLYGAAAKSSLEKGTSKLVGVDKELASMTAAFEKMVPILGKLFALFLLDSFFKADQYVTDIKKNLAVSSDNALKFSKTLNDVASSADSLRVNFETVRQAQNELNKAYGTALMFNKETLQTSAELLDAKVMDGEATANLSQMARLNGQTLKGSLQSQEDAVNAVNAEHKTRISLKGVLQDANKVTGQIKAQLGANPAAIAAAVTQAKALGMELTEVAAAGKQLLDFESSIENELTAELMLGKSLNLEKARLAALTGDYDTLLQEINENVGDFGDFMSMNVLQQDALAASVGMTSDQLSNQLMKKANLAELEKEAVATGNQQLANQLSQLSATEEFEKAVQKVKDAFVGVMHAIQPIANVLGYMIDGFRMLAPIIGIAAGAMALFNIKAIYGATVSAIKSAYESVGKVPYVGIFLATAVAAGIAGKIKSMAKKAGDVASPADGKTQISTKEGGLFELSKNDDVAAGPGILEKLKNKATGLFGVGGGNTENILKNVEKTLINGFETLTSAISKINIEKLTSNLVNELKPKENNPIKGAAMGAMLTAALPILGPLALMTAPALAMSDNGIESPQQEETTSLKDGLKFEAISVLSKKLDEIKTVLQQERNIKVRVDNKIKYDSFNENNSAYAEGKQSTEINNNSSFI